MKAKVVGLPILAMHIMVLAGFSLMQGCKTAKVADVPQDQPVVLPADDLSGAKAPVLPPVSLPVPSTKSYTVQKGDTLSSIASAHGTTWKKLAECNNLSNPNQLKVGQELRISESAGTATSSVSGKHAAPVSSRPIPGSIKQGSSYVIQKGDSLSSIAKRSGLTVSEIKTANSLSKDNLVVGKSLTIPKKGAAKASVAKAAPAKAANPVPAKTAAVVAPAALPAPAPLADAAASTGSVAAVATDAAAPAVSAAPAVAPAVPAAAAPVAAAASAPVYEHVLYPGETLDDVARQYGSSQQEIMKLNNITDAASIKPGTKLLVPIPE